MNSVRKILQANRKRKSLKYIPERLFIDLTNKNKRLCLTIDCSRVNPDEAGRFRTDAENPFMQTCYFNVGKDN